MSNRHLNSLYIRHCFSIWFGSLSSILCWLYLLHSIESTRMCAFVQVSHIGEFVFSKWCLWVNRVWPILMRASITSILRFSLYDYGLMIFNLWWLDFQCHCHRSFLYSLIDGYRSLHGIYGIYLVWDLRCSIFLITFYKYMAWYLAYINILSFFSEFWLFSLQVSVYGLYLRLILHVVQL